MNKEELIKTFLDSLCAKTVILKKQIEGLEGVNAVATIQKRLNGKTFPIFIVEENGNFVASDMGLFMEEISKIEDEKIRQKIFEFCHHKITYHGVLMDDNGMIHTHPFSSQTNAINSLLALETIVYFALDTAI
ncbi:MAG: hypothetical protein WCR30_03780 [Clostridia bacterium]